ILVMSDPSGFSRITSTPELVPFKGYQDAGQALEQLRHIYDRNTAFLRDSFAQCLETGFPRGQRFRACYPAVRLRVDTYQEVDSRLSYGHVVEPGVYMTTITAPGLYHDYLLEQLELLLRNHGVQVEVGESSVPIPLHFALNNGVQSTVTTVPESPGDTLRDHFDVPDLAYMDDAIVNGTWERVHNEPLPLAPFTAPRIDYSLHRLQHYSATRPEYFQNFVLFTNYQFYVDEFCQWAREVLQADDQGYIDLVEPGNIITPAGANASTTGSPLARAPQMPSYHLRRADHSGITLINIGVGPSNAKTITDHVAVLRPAAWLMLGHCAGLRTTQRLGDYVLAHGYVRQDHVLDEDLPTWVPIPPLAEIQVAL